jgi:nitroreductase
MDPLPNATGYVLPVDWNELVARRKMVRHFLPDPVPRSVLDRILDQARRVPSAGFSQGTDFLVLEGPDVERFWMHTLPPDERSGFRWPGLLSAPVIVLPIADAAAYLDRYSRADKAPAGLGGREDAWPVPYWFIDSGMAAMALLYAVVNEGLGALFFGIFREEAALLASLGVPEGKRPIGAIALGYPTEAAMAPGRAGSPVHRPRRPLEEVVHYGRW